MQENGTDGTDSERTSLTASSPTATFILHLTTNTVSHFPHSPPHLPHLCPLLLLLPPVNYRPLFFPQRGTPSGRREPLFWNGGSWLNSPRCESDLHVAESAGSLWELEQSLYEVGTHAGWSKAVLNLFFFFHILHAMVTNFSLRLYNIMWQHSCNDNLQENKQYRRNTERWLTCNIRC